jgi:hypothetical protein
MHLKKLVVCAAMAVSGLAGAATPPAPNPPPPPIKWNAQNTLMSGWSTLLNGSACIKGDMNNPSATPNANAWVISAGSDFAVVFDELGGSLPGLEPVDPATITVGPPAPRAPLGFRTNCSIRVPVELPKGFYLSDLSQTITYGILKDKKAEAKVSVSTSFFSNPITPLTITAPWNVEVNEPMKTASRADTFLVTTPPSRSACRGTGTFHGLYKAEFAITGRRESDTNNLIVKIDGLDLRWDVVASLWDCTKVHP